jgi:hypothetical protein
VNVRKIVVLVMLAVLMGGPPAEAARKKGRVKATVNGKRIKFKRYLHIAAGDPAVPFLVIAQTRARLGGLLRQISIGCADFPPATMPGALPFCFSQYTETRISRQPTIRGWQNTTGQTQVTIQSYDGTAVVGQFSGALDSLSGDPPITIEGEFRGRVAAPE